MVPDTWLFVTEFEQSGRGALVIYECSQHL